VPPTYLGKTPNAANANLDTLPQLPGLLDALPANVVAALAKFNVVPVVASAAARDALIPAPVANQRVQRSDTGFQERYSGAAWLPEGVTRAAGPVVTPFAKNAKGTGAVDDHQALLDTDLAVATVGRAELDPGTYRIDVNTTLSGHWRPARGAIFKPSNGVTLTFTGPFDPGAWQVFDLSLGGTVSFVGNRSLDRYLFQWWGVVGDLVNNDDVPINKCLASIPDGANVKLTSGLRMKLANSCSMSNRDNVTISYHPIQGSYTGNMPEFHWYGSGPGTGGKMFNWDRTRFCVLEGVVLRFRGQADVGVELDGYANGQIGSQCEIRHCYFDNSTDNNLTHNAVGVYISRTARNNQEFHKIIDCSFNMCGGPFIGYNRGLVTMAAGSVNFALDSGVVNFFTIGTRFRAAYPNPAVPGDYLLFDTTIASITDAMHGTTAAPAPAGGIAALQCILGMTSGECIHVGSSQNAKHIIVRDSSCEMARYGIYIESGSIYSENNDFHEHEWNIYIGSSSEMCYSKNDTCEATLGHVSSVGLFQCENARISNDWCAPAGGMIQNRASAYGMVCLGNNYEDVHPGTLIYDIRDGSAGPLLSIGNRFQQPTTLAQSGLALGPNQQRVLSLDFGLTGMGNPTEAPTLWIRGGGTWTQAFLTVDGSASKSTVYVDSAAPRVVGFTGAAELKPGGGGTAATYVGLQGEVMQNPGNNNNASAIAVVAMPAKVSTGSGLTTSVGFQAESPSVSGGGAIGVQRGVWIKKQSVTGVVTPGGLYQEDTGDPNLLNGLTTFGSGRVEKATVYIDIGAGGNATPNPAGAEEYRYRIAGAATINVPLNPQKGMPFKLVIFNNTAGAITPTLNGIFLGAGFGAIGAGKSRSRIYMYDDVAAKWEPIGAVSEDF
jgi:hypothetical protein